MIVETMIERLAQTNYVTPVSSSSATGLTAEVYRQMQADFLPIPLFDPAFAGARPAGGRLEHLARGIAGRSWIVRAPKMRRLPDPAQPRFRSCGPSRD